MIVVDTNVIAYLLIRGERSAAMDRLQQLDSEWVAPRLWLDEFLNVLCTHERFIHALCLPQQLHLRYQAPQLHKK
nr:hypothetical protein [Alteromonas macleodii]